MNPLTWAEIARLIIEIGLPATERLIGKWSSKSLVTPEEFAEVREIAAMTATDRMKLALIKAGIDPESEQGKSLLALTASP